MTPGRLGLLGVVSVCLLAAGCAVDQHKETAIYRNVLKGKVPGEARAFGTDRPLSLKQAMQLANEHDEQLAISGEDYLQALIDKDRAVSRFIPTISLEPSYLRQEPTHAAPGNPLIHQFVPDQAVDVPLHAKVDVNLPGARENVASAAATAQARRSRLLALQSRVLFDVARSYYQVLQSQRQVQVLGQSLKVQQRRVADITAKEKAGVARPLDVSQSEAQAANTRVQLTQARNDVGNGRALLAFLIGVPEVRGKLVDRFHVPARLPLADVLRRIAYGHRDDLRAARQRIHAADSNLKAAWDEYFPSLSLNLTYFLHRETFPPDVNWETMVSVHLPIFAAGRIHQDVRMAWSRLRQARLAASLLARRVGKELAVNVNDLDNARRRITELKVELTAAAQAYRQADQSYEVGAATNLERLIAQDRLLAAQLKLATEKLRHKLLFIELERNLGRLSTAALADPAGVLKAPPVAKPATSSPRASPTGLPGTKEKPSNEHG